MQFQKYILFLSLFLLLLSGSFVFLGQTAHAQATTVDQTLSLTPTPTPAPSNAFNYTPLPAVNGPENAIIEVTPLTATRSIVQVDDSVTFSVTLQNRASYSKELKTVCFESTDGNFGCQWGINLAPGQTFTINNVGTWTQGGTKNVWVTWSQDGMNYYQPRAAQTATIQVLG